MIFLRQNNKIPTKAMVLIGFAILFLTSCGVMEKLANRNPVIKRMYATNYLLASGDTTTIYVVAEDPDGDLLEYSWSKDGGSFVSPQESDRRVWQAPTAAGSYTISVTVRDENDGEAREKVTVVVRSDDPPRVEIQKPVEGESIPGIGSYEIEVEASHQTSEIERVDFIINGTVLHTDRSHVSNIYTFDWNVNGLSGLYTIQAKAYRLIVPEPPGIDSVHVLLEGVTPVPLLK